MNSPGHLRIEEIKLQPGQEWTDDSQAWRFVRDTSGAAYWLELNSPRALNEGETVVIAPSARAVIRASQLNAVLMHGFQFIPDLLCGFFTVAERHLFEATPQARPARFLPSTHVVSQQIGSLVSRPHSSSDLGLRTELLSLAVAFMSEGLVQPHIANTRSLTAHSRFLQLMTKMPDMELIQHSPDELADLCGCSSRHFNRLFRSHFGMAPRTKQTELRLMKARHLLTAENSKVIDVALESGYRSLSLFNSLFRRRFGMSPSEFRQKCNRTNGGS